MRLKKFVAVIFLAVFPAILLQAQPSKNNHPNVWPVEKANAWYVKHKWINGSNFIPGTAINQLEMWQASTFGPETIDRELGYAKALALNNHKKIN